MRREDAPGFGRGFYFVNHLEGDDVNCWECDHADCINRRCLKYDFDFSKVEAMHDYKCDYFKEL